MLWGDWLVSGGRDGSLRVHAPDTLACAHVAPDAHGAGAVVHCLASASDGLLLSGGSDGRVRQWRWLAEQSALAAAGSTEAAMEASSPVRALLHLQHAGGGLLCASGHQDGTLQLWQTWAAETKA